MNDRLRIETPEQIALELPIAGIGSRFLAVVIDTVLQFALLVGGTVLFAFVPFFIAAALGRASSVFLEMHAFALFILFWFVVFWGYFALFETFWKGQTPGKRVARIRVIKESGRPINAYEAIGRNFLRVIDFLPGMYAVGVVCMLLNASSKRLGDFVAGTVVVHDKRTEGLRPDLPVGGSGIPMPDAARLTSEEILLIETYLVRRFDLDAEVRYRTADEIAGRIAATTGLTRQPDQHVDDFLEAVVRQARDAARLR